MMPNMDGFELCRQLKADKRLSHIPVILFSVTYTDIDSAQLAEDVGASRFILKTMEPGEFIAEINDVIHQYAKNELEVPTSLKLDEAKLDRLHYQSVVKKLSKKIEQLSSTSKSLQISEERYRTLIEGTSDAIITVDKDDIVTSWNPGAENMIGLTAAEIIGTSLSRLVPEYNADEMKALLSQVVEKGFVKGYETSLLHGDGSVIQVDISLGEMRTEDGKSLGSSAIIRDITLRKETEESLRQKTSELSATVRELSCLYKVSTVLEQHDMSLDLIFHDIVEIIAAALNDQGGNCVKIIYRGNEFVSINFRETEWKLSLEIMAHGEKVGELASFKYDKPDAGTDSPFKDEEKRLLEDIVLHLQSCIERRASREEKIIMEKRLAQSQKMEVIGTLAGGIAHDFNNILTPIIGYSEMVLDSLPEGAEARQNLRKVIMASQRAAKLVKQILLFSRQGDQDKQPIQIHLIIKEALKLLRSTIPTDIEFRENIETCGTVLCDPTEIHQITMNLCTNSYHAMQLKGGTLNVSLSEKSGAGEAEQGDDHQGKYVMLEVSDTGIGMNKEVQKNIFDPFFTTKEVGKGTGLGLSVVHGIVSGMGGHITVKSEPDRGTVFRVYFPICEKDNIDDEKKERNYSVGGHEKLLFVDDEEVIVQLNLLVLEKLGYQVTGFTSSKEALECFSKDPRNFDLIITDMAMSGLNGTELAAKIHTIRPDIPIILCSGYSAIIDHEKSKDLGLADYLQKPISARRMDSAIRSILGKK